MSIKRWKIFEALTSHINKSPILAGAIENASGNAQMQLTKIRNIATKKYDTIIKHVHGATIIQDLRSASLEPAAPIPKKLVDWWSWYQQLTGLEDVELAKRQMIMVQDKLFNCQDQRRNLTIEVSIIAERLKEIYGELIQTKRDDPKYVQLTIMENKALREQSTIMSQMNVLENEERDYFTQLATYIKEYQDSQTMNAQKYKYLSMLASAFIAILSLGGSMIYNNKRIANVHSIIDEGQRKNEILFTNHFDSLKKSVDELRESNWPIVSNDSSTIEDSTIEDSTIEDSTIEDSTIEDSTNVLDEILFSKYTIVIGTLCFFVYLYDQMS